MTLLNRALISKQHRRRIADIQIVFWITTPRHLFCLHIFLSSITLLEIRAPASKMRFFIPTQSLLLLACIKEAFASPIIKEQRPLLSGSSEDPYTPSYHDQYDHKVDSVGDDLDPLPYRNGDGASILGPQNKDRTRQNPDLMRPPTTDHGDMKNMRWSYADSHVRIEVRIV